MFPHTYISPKILLTMESFTNEYGEVLNQPLSGSSMEIDGLVCGGKVMLDWNIVVLILVIMFLVACFFKQDTKKIKILDHNDDVVVIDI